MNIPFRFSITAALTLAWFATAAHASVKVEHIYELNNSYVDELGGPSIAPHGGTLNSTNYSFGSSASGGNAFEGLSLDNGLADGSNYSIEIDFRWNDAFGWGKILDFKNLSGSPSDYGLYTSPSNSLTFHSGFGAGTSAMPADTDFHLVITRDSTTDLFSAYLNGNLEFSFTDSGNRGVFDGSDEQIWFFVDDHVISDERSGTVDRIRIYDGVLDSAQVSELFAGGRPPGLPTVPETTSLLIWAGLASVVGLVKSRRRRGTSLSDALEQLQ